MKLVTSFLALLCMSLAVAPSGRAASEHEETAPPAATGKRIFEKISSLQMKGILSRMGYKGIEIDGDDDLIIKMDERPVLVIVRGSSYTNIQFRYSVRAEATLEWVNKWNREKKYTKAYLDAEDDPVLELDLDLAGGVTEARIRDGVSTFSQSLALFLQELTE